MPKPGEVPRLILREKTSSRRPHLDLARGPVPLAGLCFAVFILTLSVKAVAAEVACPAYCTCEEKVTRCEDKMVANCGGAESETGGAGDGAGLEGTGVNAGRDVHVKITAVPQELPHNDTLTSLVVARTCVRHLNGSAFRNFPHLRLLDLNTNDLEVIENLAFLELRALETLVLRRNNLRAFTELSFSGLTKLKVLDLSYNHFVELGRHWFRPMTQLENLNLDVNMIESIEIGAFADLRRLQVLTLDRNKLLRLSGDFLSDLPGLQQLVLSDNNIISIEDDSFAQLKQLRILSFTGNPQMDGQYITPAAFGVGGSSTGGSLPLEELSLKGTNFQVVPREFFRTLRQLKSLDLSQTAIRTVGSQSFQDLSSLVNLTLDSLDELTVVESRAFRGLARLERLRLSNNKALNNLSWDALRDLPSLRYLDLRNNGLQTLRAEQANWSSIGLVDLRGNPFRCDCQTVWIQRLASLPGSRNTTTSTTTNTTTTTTMAPAIASSDNHWQLPAEAEQVEGSAGVGKFCNYSDSSSSSSDSAVSNTATLARQIACHTPPQLHMRCLASLHPAVDLGCPGGLLQVRRSSDDTDQRFQVGIIVASLTVFCLCCCALFLKFRLRLASACRRQYRYKAQRHRSPNGGFPTADIVELETTQLEDLDSDAEVNGKL